MVLRLRATGLLVLLWSATLLAQTASAQNDSAQTNSSADPRGTHYSAQIAHHTELPYIRDPLDPSNDLKPLGGDDDGVKAPPSSDQVASNATKELDNEDNHVAAVDDLGDVIGRVLPIGPQTKDPPIMVPRAPVFKVSSEHPPFPPSYGALTSRPDYGVRTFKCTFENHTCGMRNQKNIGPNFKRAYNRLYGRPGHYMAVDAALVGYGVSRLITPYLPGYPNSIACLQFAYIVAGPGAERIQVVAQDVGNRPLFTLENHGHVWRTFGINMTVNQDVRFFIEAYTNRHQGVIAIDDFTYSFDPCPPNFRP